MRDIIRSWLTIFHVRRRIPKEVRRFVRALGYNRIRYLGKWEAAQVYNADRGIEKKGIFILYDKTGVRVADYGEVNDLTELIG